jgi:hypothetical protein
MNSPLNGLLVAAVIVLSAVLGGGVYEHLVIDPSWPKCPNLIQPKHEGVRRGRFGTAIRPNAAGSEPSRVDRSGA